MKFAKLEFEYAIGTFLTLAIIICIIQIIRLLFAGARRTGIGYGNIRDTKFKEDTFNKIGIGPKIIRLILYIIIFVSVSFYFDIPLFFSGNGEISSYIDSRNAYSGEVLI